MNEEEKVIITMHREPLASEREEQRKKRKHRLLITLLCVIFLIVGFIGGCLAYKISYESYLKDNPSVYDEASYVMKNAWIYGDEHENLDKELQDKALQGMSKFEEDPYTEYMSIDEFEDFSDTINMDYVGIGVSYTTYDDSFTINKVFKNSPAEKAGILPGDILKKVDDISLSGLSSDDVKALVLGVEGSDVKITVLRAGELIDLIATREKINSSVYCYSEDDYVVLQLSSFGEDSAKTIMMYLDDYTDFSKIIIDLRDNTGGYQSAVKEIAGLFIGNGKVYLKQRNKQKEISEDYTKCDKTYDNYKKIVVLTNKYTASAAEVLAICLKEQFPNTTIVGETSFGKGVIQTPFVLQDGSFIKVTTSEWLSPNGVSIHKNGIKPDVEVKLPDIMYEPLYDMPAATKLVYDCVSPFVRTSQLCLSFLNYDVDRNDGYFDEKFMNALNEFKTDNNLQADGVLDSNTYQTICSVTMHECLSKEKYDTQMLKAIEVIHED